MFYWFAELQRPADDAGMDCPAAAPGGVPPPPCSDAPGLLRHMWAP